MELIKLDEDRFLVKDSGGKIISKEDVVIMDIESNKCVKDLYKGIKKNESKSKSIKKTKQTDSTDNKQE